MGKFKFKQSIPVGYETQKQIYRISRGYRCLPLTQRKKIDRLCISAGGESAEALKEFVTTDAGATAVCGKYFLSKSTLVRIVRRYYIAFSESM